jgi:hypothetical protein
MKMIDSEAGYQPRHSEVLKEVICNVILNETGDNLCCDAQDGSGNETGSL